MLSARSGKTRIKRRCEMNGEMRDYMATLPSWVAESIAQLKNSPADLDELISTAEEMMRTRN